jgi:ribosomal protein S18 acetylase RimI-like enzyme
MSIRIDVATAEDADAVVEMWVSLATGQRSHGSHLAAEENRKQIRDAVARHIVLDGLRVARLSDDLEETPEGEMKETSVDEVEETSEDGPGALVGDSSGDASDSQSRSVGSDVDTGRSLSVDQQPEQDSDLLGFVMFDLEAGTYTQDVSRGIVRNLYVRPEYRGDGVGRVLLTTAEAALDDAGADVVTLEAMAANERARSFYHDQDYVPHRIEFEKPLNKTDQSDTHTRED